MKIDYHVHTSYSDDSIYLMEDCIKDAIAQGIEEIAITDHVDYGVKVDWDEEKEIVYRNGDPIANVNYPEWEKELTALQKNIKNKFKSKWEWNLEYNVIL